MPSTVHLTLTNSQGATICLEVQPGFSAESGADTPAKCTDRFIAPFPGMRECLPCDAQALSNQDNTECLCALLSGCAATDNLPLAGQQNFYLDDLSGPANWTSAEQPCIPCKFVCLPLIRS